MTTSAAAATTTTAATAAITSDHATATAGYSLLHEARSLCKLCEVQGLLTREHVLEDLLQRHEVRVQATRWFGLVRGRRRADLGGLRHASAAQGDTLTNLRYKRWCKTPQGIHAQQADERTPSRNHHKQAAHISISSRRFRAPM